MRKPSSLTNYDGRGCGAAAPPRATTAWTPAAFPKTPRMGSAQPKIAKSYGFEQEAVERMLRRRRARTPDHSLKILLDHNLQSCSRCFFPATPSLRRARWCDRLKNGGLLTVAEEAQFEVLLTGDQNLSYR